MMLDTYIGANDGVPILIPPSEGSPSGRLLDTMAVFEKDQVPAFIRALESAEPNDRNGTVAEMGLKLRGLEPLSKVVVCRWPALERQRTSIIEFFIHPLLSLPKQNGDLCY